MFFQSKQIFWGTNHSNTSDTALSYVFVWTFHIERAITCIWNKLLQLYLKKSWLLTHQVGLLNVDGFYNSLLSFIDMAVEEGFISQAARHIIISAHSAKDLMRKLEVKKETCIDKNQLSDSHMPCFLIDLSPNKWSIIHSLSNNHTLCWFSFHWANFGL